MIILSIIIIIMSNSNIFYNSNFQQTFLDDAYKFNTFSPYIMNGGLHCKFSPFCIFCSSNNTMNLSSDGHFKHCNGCRKQFKANLLHPNETNK
jgi:hypothetical protein